MNTTIKFKIHTIIANCDASQEQKVLLETYVTTLPEQALVQLVGAFEKEPRAVALYADYIKKLQGRTQPLSPKELEETLVPLFTKLI